MHHLLLTSHHLKSILTYFRYIGTEGGIYEFRVNVKSRMFYPSVTMR